LEAKKLSWGEYVPAKNNGIEIYIFKSSIWKILWKLRESIMEGKNATGNDDILYFPV
jgi:hypothetical protein